MTKIALLLAPGFADWEYAFIAGIGGSYYGLDIEFFSTHSSQLTSQGGLNCSVRNGLGDLAGWSPTVIAVIGGLAWEQPDAPDIQSVLQDQLASGGSVAGICGGTLALARAGLLNNSPHTSNSLEFLANAQNYAGATHYSKRAYAFAVDRIITSPGTAPISFTAEVFKAAGLHHDTVAQFKTMMKQEH
ncbi:MAG: DJ-1/PfpI family protein [Paracoccaceae bacterium]